MLAQAQALRVRAVNNAEEQLPEKEGYTIVGTEVHHMIHKCDNDMMPITITEITYQDEEGFCLLDYHCVDKRNGNVIDYAHIGIAE